jgi:thioredoxin reductase (NADPH)
MAAALHAQALAEGRIRYCPICDGYEVTDQAVAVIGRGARAAKEAEFLRSYTDRVTLIGDAADDALSAADRSRLAALGVTLVGGPVRAFHLTSDGLTLSIGERRLRFDAVYPALGSTVHSKLAGELGATLTAEGCVKVDAHQRTCVEDIYAAGDVVVGLDQISHAMGEGGVAATALRNDLAAQAPQLRA